MSHTIVHDSAAVNANFRAPNVYQSAAENSPQQMHNFLLFE